MITRRCTFPLLLLVAVITALSSMVGRVVTAVTPKEEESKDGQKMAPMPTLLVIFSVVMTVELTIVGIDTF